MEETALNPFIIEFQQLLAEGWKPDREEFLSRVPDEERAEVAAAIDAILAAQGPEPEAPEPEPSSILKIGTDQYSLDAAPEPEPER